MTKQNIIASLARFVDQRPGLNFADYGDRDLYQRDYRQNCAKPKADFMKLVIAVDWHDSLTADDLLQAIRQTNRLDMLDDGSIDYTPGQMGALEYRHAACNALSRALWNHWGQDTPENATPREYITRTAKGQFGRGLTARHFD